MAITGIQGRSERKQNCSPGASGVGAGGGWGEVRATRSVGNPRGGSHRWFHWVLAFARSAPRGIYVSSFVRRKPGQVARFDFFVCDV